MGAISIIDNNKQNGLLIKVGIRLKIKLPSGKVIKAECVDGGFRTTDELDEEDQEDFFIDLLGPYLKALSTKSIDYLLARTSEKESINSLNLPIEAKLSNDIPRKEYLDLLKCIGIKGDTPIKSGNVSMTLVSVVRRAIDMNTDENILVFIKSE